MGKVFTKFLLFMVLNNLVNRYVTYLDIIIKFYQV